jgi:ATP-dependent DNA helicase RecG
MASRHVDRQDNILGAEDDGTVMGVNWNAAKQMKKNFVNMPSNPQMISPALFLSLEEVEVENKLCLYYRTGIASSRAW